MLLTRWFKLWAYLGWFFVCSLRYKLVFVGSVLGVWLTCAMLVVNLSFGAFSGSATTNAGETLAVIAKDQIVCTSYVLLATFGQWDCCLPSWPSTS